MPGEKLKTLDGVERELTNDMLVIADAERPVALAGIMGGEESEISATTTDVLIESAYFNPDSVRQDCASFRDGHGSVEKVRARRRLRWCAPCTAAMC